MSFFSTAPAHEDLVPAAVEPLRGKARIIDVREPEEFVGDLGHIPEAELVPLGRLGVAARAWPKDAELIMVCRSGARSGRAAAELARAGFTRVHNMLGGMMRWRHEGRAVAR
ncbi:MAG: rhodanese-like domain-containing protein [Deltaproteobacteria bacterium]|nr:rhodanese-like domain-containing protein [Deltaproteobacteria bacterium]